MLFLLTRYLPFISLFITLIRRFSYSIPSGVALADSMS